MALLPRRLESFAPGQELVRAPGALAIEPPALSWRALGRLPAALADRISAAQARAALRFTDVAELWERMEALGIESGRLGSERG